MTALLTRNILVLIWLTSVQFIFVGVSNGQVNKSDTTILLKAFRQVTSQGQIIYVDTVNATGSMPERLKEIIQKGKLIDKGQGNTTTLTKAEQDYLLAHLSQRTVWVDNLFSNSRRIDADSMWTYLNQENKKRSVVLNNAALQNDTSRIKKQQYDYPYVFAFIKPIYIRDNTVCLISFGAMCGVECGQTETSFYKKENNEWTKWIIVSAGDF